MQFSPVLCFFLPLCMNILSAFSSLAPWSCALPLKVIVACRTVAGLPPWDKQIYTSRYWVTASQTSMCAREQWETTMERCFPSDPNRNVRSRTVSASLWVELTTDVQSFWAVAVRIWQLKPGAVPEPRVRGTSMLTIIFDCFVYCSCHNHWNDYVIIHFINDEIQFHFLADKRHILTVIFKFRLFHILHLYIATLIMLWTAVNALSSLTLFLKLIVRVKHETK
jgi:hypothetical protein